MITLYAQPYDISASGFYFTSFEEYTDQSNLCCNDYGDPVEEFEIQFIDGEDLDCKLFRALGIHQGTIGAYFEKMDEYDDDQKIKMILAIEHLGYSFDLEKDDPDNLDIDIYEIDTMRDLAVQFVDDGLFGDIPDHLQNYIDYDAIAHDLSCDYSEAIIRDQHYVFREG